MGRYSTQSLEARFAWMRDRQQRKKEDQQKPAEPLREAAGPLPQMLRVNQVAQALAISPRTVQRWFRDCAIIVQGPRKVTMLIPRQALDEWIRGHSNSR